MQKKKYLTLIGGLRWRHDIFCREGALPYFGDIMQLITEYHITNKRKWTLTSNILNPQK
jgi:hypothetical protein